MNFVFVSPQFPATYWQFCDRLKRDGANVLGIGDTPEDALEPELRGVLSEYYYVPDMRNYDDMFRAVAYFSYRYGRIDWLESNNEYWLSTDARLRTDFNITTGAKSDQMAQWQSKAAQKPLYAKAGVPSARQVRVAGPQDRDAAFGLAREVGYPLFAKPERGVGAEGSFRLSSDHDLDNFFYFGQQVPYVVEEFVPAEAICAWDAILDSHSEPLFENMETFPPSMSDLVRDQRDLAYWCSPDVDPELSRMGRATAKAFGLKSRFVHMEFFRLAEDRQGLGPKGGYVGLEVNCRPTGGFTPDMMNYAHATDVYQIWADMVFFDQNHVTPGPERCYCVFAGRRDVHEYAHSHEEVLERWGDAIVTNYRLPDGLSDDMGNYQYTARLASAEERDEFIRFVQEQR